MSTKTQEMQRVIRRYREKTGVKEWDMHEVAKFATGIGWPLPEPPKPIDILAKQFSQAAREEVKHDKKTGRPYRVNHAFKVSRGGEQLTFWVDIDEATRKTMLKSAVNRREQMVGDALQLTLDLDHWNRVNSKEEKIELPLDLGPDVNWRLNAPDENEKTG